MTLAVTVAAWPAGRFPRPQVAPLTDGQVVNVGELMSVAGCTPMVTAVSSLVAWVVQTVIEKAAVWPGCTCDPLDGCTWMQSCGASELDEALSVDAGMAVQSDTEATVRMSRVPAEDVPAMLTAMTQMPAREPRAPSKACLVLTGTTAPARSRWSPASGPGGEDLNCSALRSSLRSVTVSKAHTQAGNPTSPAGRFHLGESGRH